MSMEKIVELLELQLECNNRQAIAMERIATAVEMLIQSTAGEVKTPDAQAILEEYPNFDWEGFGCQVVGKDSYGVTAVKWNGKIYKRRSPENAYGPTIFFSRSTGKTDDGKPDYERLITFKPRQELSVQPVSRKAEAVFANKN